jgi:oxygen-dependent protoporphyrinogen oxidase
MQGDQTVDRTHERKPTPNSAARAPYFRVHNAESNAARSDDTHHDVIVVGGGISGLTAAWHLRRAGRDVALLEARDVVGGSIETEARDGFLLEKGPFNVIVRDPAFEELLGAVAGRVNVVSASDAAKNRYIYRHGKLNAVPTGAVAFARTGLLTPGARLRAARGLLLSRRGRAAETTIAEFATRRFGAEVADSIVSAAIAGILAGDIRKLSAYACFPVLRDFDQKSISPLGRTLRRVPTMIRKRFNPALQRKWKGLVSIDRGLGGLCAAIADEIGAVQTGAPVCAIDRAGDDYVLTVGDGDQTRTLRCRQLVLATPANVAAKLLRPHVPSAADEIDAIDSASLTVVNLGFRRGDISHPLDGFGFLVPHNEPKFPLMGVLFASTAFPHHAPTDQHLLRVFFGGSRTPDVIERSADELVATARSALANVLGVKGTPALVDVCPYPDAIPQYYLGHTARVERIRAAMASLPGVHLAGNYLDGVSINDCVKLGKAVAADVSAPVALPQQGG